MSVVIGEIAIPMKASRTVIAGALTLALVIYFAGYYSCVVMWRYTDPSLEDFSDTGRPETSEQVAKRLMSAWGVTQYLDANVDELTSSSIDISFSGGLISNAMSGAVLVPSELRRPLGDVILFFVVDRKLYMVPEGLISISASMLVERGRLRNLPVFQWNDL